MTRNKSERPKHIMKLSNQQLKKELKTPGYTRAGRSLLTAEMKYRKKFKLMR